MNLAKYHACDECKRVREDTAGWFLVSLTRVGTNAFALLIRPWDSDAAREPGVHHVCSYDHALQFAQLFRRELEACARSNKETHHDTEEEDETARARPSEAELGFSYSAALRIPVRSAAD